VSLDISPVARASASSVIRAYRLSRITEADWFDEFDTQSRMISTSPIEQRVEFYAAVLVDCHMDTHIAETFLDTVGVDEQSLRRYLERLAASPQYLRLSDSKREEVRLWKDSLDPD
jgi:hypothetical protein